MKIFSFVCVMALAAAPLAGGSQSERRMFTNADLNVLAVLQPRCEH